MTLSVRVLLIVGLAGLTFGCGKKTEQCNKVATAANAGVLGVKKLKLEKPEEFDEGAKILEKASKEMKSLELSDEKLRGLNNTYADALAARAVLMRQVSKANDETIASSVKEMNVAISNEDKLVDQIAAYCKN